MLGGSCCHYKPVSIPLLRWVEDDPSRSGTGKLVVGSMLCTREEEMLTSHRFANSKVNVVQPYSWVQVKQCATGEYCCNPNFDNGDCCKDKSPRFNVKTPTPKPKPVTKTSSSSLSSTPPSMSTSALSSDAAQPTSPDGSSNNDDNGDTSSPKSKSKSMTGPIVGGVVGGIAAIAAVGGLWWFFRRKSMARAAAAAAASTDPAKQQCLPSEMDGSPVLVESDSKPIPRPVYEMSG